MPKAAAAPAQAPLWSMHTARCAALGVIGMVGLAVSAVGPFKLPFAETLAKTYYRQAVFGLLLVAVAIAALVTAVVKLFDPNQFKEAIVRHVQQRMQRELVLDGELTMRWFPKLGLDGGRASLSQRRSAREFASIERLHLTIAWLSLLRGQVQVDGIELEGLKAQGMRALDGSTNVDDLWRDLLTLQAEHVDIDRLRITQAQLQWHDERLGQRVVLHDVSVDVGRLADGVPAPLRVTARVDAPQAGVDARLQLGGRVMFDAVAGRVELARIDGRLEGRALGVPNLALSIKGDVTALPRERTLQADNLVLSSAHQSGLTVFNTVLSLPSLKFGEYRLNGEGLHLEATATHPDRGATLSVKVPRFEWAERALRNATAQAQLTLSGGGAQWRAQGNGALALQLDGDGGPRLEWLAVEATAQANHPALVAELAAQLKGRIDVKLNEASVHSTWGGQLAGQPFEADIGLVDALAAPRFSAKGSVRELDLRAFRADAQQVLRLEGRADLAWDVSSHGATSAALGDTLTGTVQATVRDGVLRDIDLRAALEGRRESVAKDAPAALEWSRDASTPFSELKWVVQWGEGRAQVQGVELLAGVLRVVGSGSLALDSGALDLHLQASAPAKGVADLASQAGATVPLYVSGPWRTPRVAFEPAAAGAKPQRQGDAVPSQAVEAVSISR